MVTTVFFIDAVTNMASVIKAVIISDSQIALPHTVPLLIANHKMICRNPVSHGIGFRFPFQEQFDFVAFQKIRI